MLLHISILTLLLAILATSPTTAQSTAPFKIQASSPRSRVNGAFVQVIATEGTFFAPVFQPKRASAATFNLNPSSGHLSTQVYDRFADQTVQAFVFGRFDVQRYRGEARLWSRERLGKNFAAQVWDCTIVGGELKCQGPDGGRFWVCSEYDWIFLRDEKPDLGCEGLVLKVLTG